MTADPLQAWLETQTKAQLIKLIEAQCRNDGDFLNALQLKAAAGNPAKNMEQIKKTIHNAFWIEDFVDWREAASYASNLDPVIDTLRNMLENGEAEAVIELVEEALDCWTEAANNIHDDGEMGMVLDDLYELHLNACRKARPDPVELAENLFLAASTNREWGIFDDAYTTYAALLGKAGKKRYRALVETKWNKLPKPKPGQKDDSKYDADWFDSLMIQFAKEDTDFSRELQIMQRDLSSAWEFLKIAERYQAEKQPALALEWIENGLHHFKDSLRLQEKCAELYWKAKRRDDALAIWWNLFEGQRSLPNYQRLVEYAAKHKQLDVWREKALASIRADIAARKAKSKGWWDRSNHSLLVEIFLWENDPEQAWNEAQGGGCSAALWLKLCAKREVDHPADVYPIYMKLADEAVQKKNNDAYREAVGRIKKARMLAERCGLPGVFDTHLRKIKLAHKPKRNFMKYLAEAGL
ncbi:hypothetical protein [Pontiella sp.]|uniref:hypothetical protein n=1 Tax=Pontiella sp. TaxID=2837462 RepID=UPI00356371C6